jgi:hypothetical protein
LKNNFVLDTILLEVDGITSNSDVIALELNSFSYDYTVRLSITLVDPKYRENLFDNNRTKNC